MAGISVDIRSLLRPFTGARPPEVVVKANGFSSHFQAFLKKEGLGDQRWMNPALTSFGGRTRANEKVTRTPVVFIHGNSDDAASWEPQINYFLEKGYKRSELYALTWGEGAWDRGFQDRLDPARVAEVKDFLGAVKKYTGKPQVTLVTHSQGGPLGIDALADVMREERKLNPHAPKPADRFVSVAGAFRGTLFPPSAVVGLSPLNGELKEIRAEPRVADHVYDLTSWTDEIIGYGYGPFSGRAPHRDGGVVRKLDGHMSLRDEPRNVALEYEMATGAWTPPDVRSKR